MSDVIAAWFTFLYIFFENFHYLDKSGYILKKDIEEKFAGSGIVRTHLSLQSPETACEGSRLNRGRQSPCAEIALSLEHIFSLLRKLLSIKPAP